MEQLALKQVPVLRCQHRKEEGFTCYATSPAPFHTFECQDGPRLRPHFYLPPSLDKLIQKVIFSILRGDIRCSLDLQSLANLPSRAFPHDPLSI